MGIKKENNDSNQQQNLEEYSLNDYLKFLIPSIIGIILFLTPIYVNGQVTIGVGILAEYFQSLFDAYIPAFMLIIVCLSGGISLYTKTINKSLFENNKVLDALFNVGTFWMTMRLLGAFFAILTFWELGPEFIWSEFTGGTVLYALVPVLMTWFFFAGFFMPLLLEFGLMDFIGTVIRKIMKPLFKLPGRSSIDAMASWMGSGTVGVLLTTRQYEDGYYTKREAAVIATNFSVASIAFSLVVINFIGLSHMFMEFYLTVIVGGFMAAIICPRIPPLSKKENTYYEPVGKQIDEVVPEGRSRFQWGLEKAVQKASQVKSIGEIAKKGIVNVLDIWFGLIPLVIAIGTIALVLAEFTPIFNILSYPLVPILMLLQIPEANLAAPAIMVGFADMFLPAVIGSEIESELTRFVIAVISMTQLIYMSEVGILLLKSKIPLSLRDLLIIFIQRTMITLPIAAAMAHLFFF